MKSTFKPQIKKPSIKLGATARMLLLYFTASIAAFSAIILLGRAIGSGSQLFNILLVGMFLLGLLHVWLMIRFFEWDRPVLHKTLFTLGVTVIAMVALYFWLRNSNSRQLGNLYSVTALAFALPHFYKMAIDQIISIPQKIYKPLSIETFDDIDRGSISFEENERGLIWKFEAADGMSADLSLPTESVRMFAPKQVFHMPFKKLFKASVLFHNVRLKPHKPIEVFEETATGKKLAYEWYFMHRPFPFMGLRYIDPDKTVAQNGIRFTKRKTNYGKEILAPEIFVIRQQNSSYFPDLDKLEEEEEANNLPDADANNAGGTGSRVEF